MPKIDSIGWRKIKIDGKEYWQVLIVGGEIIPREVEKVKRKYGTDHVIANWEKKLLLSKNPQVILIATGWGGILKVEDDFEAEIRKRGIKLEKVLTSKIKKEYNRLNAEGYRVNALIHTTC